MKISMLDMSTLGDDLDFSGIEQLGELTIYAITLQSEVIERIATAKENDSNRVNDKDINLTDKDKKMLKEISEAKKKSNKKR